MAYLSRLRLVNYRNFREAEIDLPSGMSVFCGANAQGKTSILEAVHTLMMGRSFRADREREVVNFQAARDAEAAYITGVATAGDNPLTIVVAYQPSSPAPGADQAPRPNDLPSVSKQIRVNRQPSTASGLVGRIGATLFVVDDLDIVLGSPSNRRRYLDVLISQADRSYLNALQRYQSALRNRNGLLRRKRDGHAVEDEMEYWDDQLIQSGAAITLQRANALVALSSLARAHHFDLADPQKELAMQYRPSVLVDGSPDSVHDKFRELMQHQARRELATAVTAVGPHRDDFALFIDGMDANSFASRGEARTIALALRLAEADFLAQVRSEDPIILLDDVLSEMDAQRRHKVLQKASAYKQTIVTTTDADLIRTTIGDAAVYFRVADGNIYRESGRP